VGVLPAAPTRGKRCVAVLSASASSMASPSSPLRPEVGLRSAPASSRRPAHRRKRRSVGLASLTAARGAAAPGRDERAGGADRSTGPSAPTAGRNVPIS
jgi:hypothetical protein